MGCSESSLLSHVSICTTLASVTQYPTGMKTNDEEMKRRWRDWFRHQLLRWDMTLADFMRASGAKSATVSGWNTGNRLPRDPASIRLIADTFQVPQRRVLLAAGYLDDEYDVIPENDLRARVADLAIKMQPLSGADQNRMEVFVDGLQELGKRQRRRGTNPEPPQVGQSNGR